MACIGDVYYSINNDLQKQDAHYFLERYSKFLNLSNCETILDMGTGDGSVLQDIILPKMPSGLKHIVATDFHKDMLKLAEERFSNRSNIEIVWQTIELSDLPVKFPKMFDRIFSLYYLHFVKNIQHVFHNLLTMLKPGGKMFLTMMAYHPCFTIYQEMAKMDPWKTFMHDVSDFTSPYQHSKNPGKKIKAFLKLVGFVDYECDLGRKTHIYRTERAFWEWAMGIDPFIGRIPSDLQGRYKNDYFKVLSRLDEFAVLYNPLGIPLEITASCRILVIYATAPVIIETIIEL